MIQIGEMINKKLKNKYYYSNILKKTPDSSCSHTTISGPQTPKLTSQNRHYLCWISATHLNHNFTLSYNLLLTQNNLQFSSDNFLYIYLTPDTKLKPCLSSALDKSTKKCSAVLSIELIFLSHP